MQQTRRRPLILLVEDYPDSRQMLTLLLEDMDYVVLPAANGREALTAAANHEIDLVLTDYDLPDMTGPTVVRYLRELGNGFEHIPVIMLTAIDASEHRSLAEEAGCNEFLIKPADFEILNATIARLLKRSRSRTETESIAAD